jgi:hypothetical protein
VRNPNTIKPLETFDDKPAQKVVEINVAREDSDSGRNQGNKSEISSSSSDSSSIIDEAE